MTFSQFMRDTIHVRKQDGTSRGPYKCSVQGDKIIVLGSEVDVEDGDAVEREMPNGKVEVYHVLEAQFTQGLSSIPASWKLHVRKSTSLRARGLTSTTVNIGNAHGVQIGDHNFQQVSIALQSMVDAIDNSKATDEEKVEAKGRLAQFLQHPAVVAVFGAAAANICDRLSGK